MKRSDKYVTHDPFKDDVMYELGRYMGKYYFGEGFGECFGFATRQFDSDGKVMTNWLSVYEEEKIEDLLKTSTGKTYGEMQKEELDNEFERIKEDNRLASPKWKTKSFMLDQGSLNPQPSFDPSKYHAGCDPYKKLKWWQKLGNWLVLSHYKSHGKLSVFKQHEDGAIEHIKSKA